MDFNKTYKPLMKIKNSMYRFYLLKNVTCTRCLKIDIMKPLHRRWQTCQDMVNLVNKRIGTA